MPHKVYDVNNKLVFEGEPEEVHEYFLKALSTRSAHDKEKYENYLKYEKK